MSVAQLNYQTVLSIKVIGKILKDIVMGKVVKFGRMDPNMKDSGQMIWQMATDA